VLLAVHQGRAHRCGLAWLSSRRARCSWPNARPTSWAWIARIAPSELLHSADVTPAFGQRLQACASPPRRSRSGPEFQFDSGLGQRKLLEQLKAASLSRLGRRRAAHAHAAAAALLAYAEHTQGRALSHVQQLQVVRDGERIELPPATRRNLELVQTLRGEDSPTCSRCWTPA
jgi:DNA mismatch repair protein MutS